MVQIDSPFIHALNYYTHLMLQHSLWKQDEFLFFSRELALVWLPLMFQLRLIIFAYDYGKKRHLFWIASVVLWIWFSQKIPKHTTEKTKWYMLWWRVVRDGVSHIVLHYIDLILIVNFQHTPQKASIMQTSVLVREKMSHSRSNKK